MKSIKLIGGIISVLLYSCERQEALHYSVPAVPWGDLTENRFPGVKPDATPTVFPPFEGSHRAIIEVKKSGEAAYLNFEWRRHDREVDKHRFIIVNESTRDTVKNIYRIEVTNEHCELIFGPVTAGNYFFYYLPFELQGGWGGYGRKYLPQESPADPAWLSENKIADTIRENLVAAKVVEVQARTEFDTFYPMEVIATQQEKDYLIKGNPGGFLLFPEDRKYPIRMLDNIPQKWVLNPGGNRFEGEALRNEYYVFQVGLWAQQDVEDVTVEFLPLTGNKGSIAVTAMTCFNTGGNDPEGRPFTKTINVNKGKVQPLWMGIDLSKDMQPGKYNGKLIIKTRNAGQKAVDVALTIRNEVIGDRGDGELWRHSRLRWLNSRLGIDDNPFPPAEELQVLNPDTLLLSGKKVVFTESGMPSSVKVWGKEILAAPIRFDIRNSGGVMQFNTAEKAVVKQTKSSMIQQVTQNNGELELTTRSEANSDGYLKYTFNIVPRKDIDLSDIQLVIPMKTEMARYMIGMGLPGMETPTTHDGKWNREHDSFWIGNTNGGLSCELLGAAYSGPLLMFYYSDKPQSWDNNGKGGFSIRTRAGEKDAIAYGGPRKLSIGDTLKFECALIITPLKHLNTKSQFTDRYFHNALAPEPSEKNLESGIKIINLHHANMYNPHINYPFIEVKKLKDFVDKWHARGMNVKIYYTVRELTNFTTEFWALRSLGDEILAYGKGGGYPWLREHVVDNYSPQWYEYLGGDKGADAAVLTSSGNTRWYNYYVEGLSWMVKEVGIDGLYIDAAAFGRDMFLRICKAMNTVKPNIMFDLHAGTVGGPPVLQYTEFFPYMNKQWFGELYNYNEMPPANWLVEVSGIPFGMMGDMLPLEQAGGENPWRGMIYGMTARLPYTDKGVTDPTQIWKVWDSFGIADSKMVGYWEDEPIVTTSSKDVLATAYLKDKKMLISIASWAKATTSVTLKIDFRRAGINPDKITMTAPEIANFQPGRKFSKTESIPVEPKKGWLLIIEE